MAVFLFSSSLLEKRVKKRERKREARLRGEWRFSLVIFREKSGREVANEVSAN